MGIVAQGEQVGDLARGEAQGLSAANEGQATHRIPPVDAMSCVRVWWG
jgi:hypothetical protein